MRAYDSPLMRKTFITLLLAAAAVSVPRAQSPQPANASTPTGLVVGSGNFFSPIVADLEKAMAFYADGLGFQIAGQPSNADTNAPLRNMFGLPGAQLRWTIARPAAMRGGVEIVEIRKAPSRALRRGIQDPGALDLVTAVRDIDAAVRRLTAGGGSVVTTGGAPVAVTLGGRLARVAVVKSPDGHFIQLVQPEGAANTSVPPEALVTDVRVRLTVADVERSMRLYRDALGLQSQTVGRFSNDPAVMGMLGLPATGEYRMATTQVPGSGLIVQFIEFKGVERHMIQGAIQDPGSTRMQLQVRDLDAAIRAVTSAGGAVVTTGGAAVELPAGRGAAVRAAIVRDPDNLFLVLIESRPSPQ
jgi:predicted enzyme related to lactoylglutathione lyase